MQYPYGLSFIVPLQTFHWNVCKVLLDEMASQGESGLIRFPLEKLSLFSPLFSVAQKHAPGVFRRLRTATRGFAPCPYQHF